MKIFLTPMNFGFWVYIYIHICLYEEFHICSYKKCFDTYKKCDAIIILMGNNSTLKPMGLVL